MQIPIQSQPILRNVSTTKIISTGIATSLWRNRPICNCTHVCRQDPEACEACYAACRPEL
jgi:hypothetical protein